MPYINDLPSVLSFSKHLIYADDTQIYVHCLPNDILGGIRKAQHDAQAIADWATQNGLQLNVLKTKVMILGSEQYTTSLNISTLPKIVINDIEIPYSDSAKSLGVTSSSTLNWKHHTTDVINKVYRSLHSLKFYRKSMSIGLRKNLVETLVLPHYSYASIVFADVDETRLNELQVAHNAWVRFVAGFVPFIPTSDITSHISYHRLKLNWLTLDSTRVLALAHLLYKILCLNGPTYLTQRIAPLNDRVIARRSSRNPPTAFYLSAHRTAAWQRSFTYRSMDLLNQLSVTKFSSERCAEFKRWLFSVLFLLETQQVNSRAVREKMTNTDALRLIPPVSQPFHVAAFTHTLDYLNVPGRYLNYKFVSSDDAVHNMHTRATL